MPANLRTKGPLIFPSKNMSNELPEHFFTMKCYDLLVFKDKFLGCLPKLREKVPIQIYKGENMILI